MPTDKHVWKVLSAGKMTWFEADKVTLSEIKARYLLNADDFLYFRKGEDWLKYLMDWFLSLGLGPDQILDLAIAYGPEILQYTKTCLNGLRELDFTDCLEWYLKIAGGAELAKKHFRFIKDKIWKPFVKRAHDVHRPFKQDFRILCNNSQENIDHLPIWKAMRTQVRFYRDDTEAGSHRFYLNEKGYAVFWRQGQEEGTRFYGFEGTEIEVVQRLKAVFEEEWAGASIPRIK